MNSPLFKSLEKKMVKNSKANKKMHDTDAKKKFSILSMSKQSILSRESALESSRMSCSSNKNGKT